MIKATMPSQTQNGSILGAQWTTAMVDALPDSSFAFVDGKTRKLPYKDANGKVDLPHVRNALARLNQTQGIPDGEKDAIRTKLQSALKNTKAADDVKLQTVHAIMADDSKGVLPTKMMLLRSGNFYTQKYGEVPLTADDLKEMKTNFDNGLGMAGSGETGIPVDYSHESHKNAGAWIKGMEVEEDSDGNAELWATDLEFSDSGKKAILGKEYKMLSSDFYPRAFGMWADAESGVTAQNVMVGAAFTNRPLFSGNQPVIASETDNSGAGGGTHTVIYINANENKERSMKIDEVRVKAADDLTGPEQRFLQAHASELSAEECEKFEIVKAAQEEKPKVVKAAEVTGGEGVVAIEASELKKINDQIDGLKASAEKSEREKLHGLVKAHAERGAIKADRIDSWVSRMLAADEKGREEILADLAAVASNPVLAKTQGSSDGDEASTGKAREKLMAAATEIVKKSDGKTTIKEAYAAARDADPELAAQAAAEGQERVAGLVASDEQFAAAGVNQG